VSINVPVGHVFFVSTVSFPSYGSLGVAEDFFVIRVFDRRKHGEVGSVVVCGGVIEFRGVGLGMVGVGVLECC
jgi:hypothetical protein